MKNAKNAALMEKLHSVPLYTIEDVDSVVHFVGSAEDWPYCEERLRAAKIVGIDSETRPVFNNKQPQNPCSLLQVAVRCGKGKREVFIIDLLNLQPKVYNAAISKLFLSKQVIKLGQGLLGDLKDLSNSYPAATCFSVAKAVVEVNDLSIALSGAHHAISLQKLAFFYINKRLTKTMQTSNWNRRPLSPRQLHYAASDSLVLIDIYDELLKRLGAKTRGAFKVESVMNVLDVHVEASLKCSLCFTVHETVALYKTHRKECIKTVHSLSHCAKCDQMLLLNSTATEAHATSCGAELALAGEEGVGDFEEEGESPMEVGDLVLASATKGSRKRARSETNSSLKTAPQPNESVSAESYKRKRKNNKKRKKASQADAPSSTIAPASNTAEIPTTPPPSRARKMSAGTLLAADDIWSEISSNLVSDQPTP